MLALWRAGVSLRNRATLAHPKWDPEEFEWEPAALKATKMGAEKGSKQADGSGAAAEAAGPGAHAKKSGAQRTAASVGRQALGLSSTW